jgi:hypothetical protein
MQFKNLTRTNTLQKTSVSAPVKHRQVNHTEYGHDKLLTQLIATLSSLYPLAQDNKQRKQIKHIENRLTNEGLNQTNRLDAIQLIKKHYAR